MPTFGTPTPGAVHVQNPAGSVSIAASARADTTVEVHPGNAGRPEDVEAAEQTIVEQRGDTIVVEAPQHRHSTRNPELRIEIGLPEDTAVTVNTASADIETTGRLGAAELTAASGNVRLEHAETTNLKTASGNIYVSTIDRDAHVASASGAQNIEQVGGRLATQTASGDLLIGDVRGDLTVQAASGDTVIRSSRGGVDVKSASGDLRIDSVRQGRVAANTASGDVAIAVAEGSAAWLELNSLSGDVRSDLNEADGPGDGDTIEIRVRTLSGDIRIARAR